MRFGPFAALVTATLLVACGGAAARKAGYMAKGQEYLAAHDFEKARLEFRNALQMDPNDAEASFLAGEASEHLGNLREAAQMFQTAIQVESQTSRRARADGQDLCICRRSRQSDGNFSNPGSRSRRTMPIC